MEQVLHPLILEHLSDMVYIFKYIIFSGLFSVFLKLHDAEAFAFFPLWVNKKNWGEKRKEKKKKERKTGTEMVLISNNWF